MTAKQLEALEQFQRTLKTMDTETARSIAHRRWEKVQQLCSRVERDDNFGGVIPQRSSVGSDGTPSSQRQPRG